MVSGASTVSVGEPTRSCEPSSGLLSSLAAAIDPTINRAVFLLAGGDLAEILWTMPEAARYRAMWIAAGRTKAELALLTAPFDPLTYAHRLKGKRVLMIAGKVDEVIPPECASALWEAAGKPPILTVRLPALIVPPTCGCGPLASGQVWTSPWASHANCPPMRTVGHPGPVSGVPRLV